MSCRLHVHRWGAAGPSIVCLHSSGLSGFQWRRLSERVPQARFLAPDFLGCGQSPPSPRGLDFRFQEDLEQVVALLDGLSEPVVLLGHSYGGFLALKSALARPESVRALALYEPVIWGGLVSARQITLDHLVSEFDPQGILFERSLAGSELWMERFVDYWNGVGTWAQMTPAAQRSMLANGDKLFAEVREVVTDPTPHTEYGRLQQPILLLHGTTSPVEVLRMKDILQDQLPQARLGCIPGGHMNPVRNPGPVNAHFELFLRPWL